MAMTETPDYPRGLTFEQVWAMFKETDLQFKETREQMKETDRRIQETERQMKETDRKMGYLENRFGELAEHLVAPSIKEKFNELNFNFTQSSRDVEIKERDNPNAFTEVDILLENGDIVIAVEVKSKPNNADVEKHIRRMEILKRAADRRSDKRKYRGAIAGAIMNQAVREDIIRNGFYLIEQSGDTVKLTIPNGFAPREW